MKMNSERIPRSLLRGWRANTMNCFTSLHFEDSPQLAVGSFNTRFFLPTLFIFMFLTSPLSARTIHVHPDSVVTRIQDGINIAEHSDTVMVFPGTYFEHDIDFLGKAIVVTSTNPFDEGVVASTVIDANALGRVFYFHNGEDTTSVLAGFTITGGYNSSGGGIELNNSSPTISWNVIKENTALSQGGGISIGYDCQPIITNNVITYNTVTEDGGCGGGIADASGRYPIIKNNVISNNSAAPTNWGRGGGIICGWSGTIITGNTITDNIADYGGGILCEYSICEVTNTILWDNTGRIGWGDEILMREEYTTLTISYSDVKDSDIGVCEGCVLNWGEGMVDTLPMFENGDGGYHLNSNSPLRNQGDPGYVPSEGERDIDGEPRVLEGRVDIGADEIKTLHIRDDNPPAADHIREAKTLE